MQHAGPCVVSHLANSCGSWQLTSLSRYGGRNSGPATADSSRSRSEPRGADTRRHRLETIRTKPAQKGLWRSEAVLVVASEVIVGEDLKYWLGGRDSNPDTVVQSHVSYRWTTSQLECEPARARR